MINIMTPGLQNRQLRPNMSRVTWKSQKELKPLKELGSWEGSQQLPGPKPILNRWKKWGLKGWMICWGFPSAWWVHMGLELRPLPAAPGFPLPIFLFLPLRCPNMPALLAGKKSNSMCWLKMKGKSDCHVLPSHPVQLYQASKALLTLNK